MYKNIFQDFLKKKIINIKTNMMYRLKFNIIGKKIYMYIYIYIYFIKIEIPFDTFWKHG